MLLCPRIRCCCCCPRQELDSNGPSLAACNVAPTPPDKNGPIVVANDPQREPSTSSSFKDMHTRKHFVVRFFRGPYYQFVTHRIWRWVILFLFLVLIGIFIGFATQIKVNEEQVSRNCYNSYENPSSNCVIVLFY